MKVTLSQGTQAKTTIKKNEINRSNTSFGQQFQSAHKRQHEKYIADLLAKIKEKSKKVLENHTVQAVDEYKKYIKEYLKYILKSAYSIKITYGDCLTVVTTINDELDELGKMVLEKEKDTLAIVNKVSKIEGLLVDVYQ